MEPVPGTLVTPHVRLERPLGAGGMGSVWLARNEVLDADVAVKLMAPDLVERPSSLARFRREASLAAKLTSPHVVQIFDHGVTEAGLPYIVMERLQGESLAERLRREKRLSPAQVATLVEQVCKVLVEAHEAGIVHRDLKPANLFLVDSGYELFLKVLDFGIAKETRGDKPSDLTTTGTTVGTPYFMSPEMLLSTKGVDHRADLWALAVVAYMALTGHVPFDGETLAALTVAIHEGVFAAPSEHVPELSAKTDAFFRHALCRTLEERPERAEDFAEALKEALADDAVAAAPLPDEAALAESLVFSDTMPSDDAALAPEVGDGGVPTSTREGSRRLVPWLAVGAIAVGVAWGARATRDGEGASNLTSSSASSTAAAPSSPSATGSSVLVSSATPPPRPVVSASAPPASTVSSRMPPAHPPQPAPARVAARPATEQVVPPPASSSAPPSSRPTPPSRPAHCSDPFRMNAQGDLVPKPECF